MTAPAKNVPPKTIKAVADVVFDGLASGDMHRRLALPLLMGVGYDRTDALELIWIAEGGTPS